MGLWMAVNPAGKAMATVSAPVATDPYNAGLRYQAAGNLCTRPGFAPANAPRIGGMARDDLGVVYMTLEATPGIPCFNNGVLCDTTGTIYGTVNNAIAGYANGLPVDSAGRICVAMT